MATPVTDNPFAVLTLIAAPAVFTNASSVLALGTGNRLARVVDRTRQLTKQLRDGAPDTSETEMDLRHITRLEQRASLLVRAMGYFYASIGSFAAASLISIFGAVLAGHRAYVPFAVIGTLSFIAGAVGFVGLVVGCVLLVGETRLALRSLSEEAETAKSRLRHE
jgi:enamine deaminase RidA (YjgF/YER057c/UK114 family)